MTRQTHTVILLLACVGFTAGAPGAGDAVAGKAKAAICAACHGADGNSVNPEWPKIAGQNYRYLVDQTLAIKAGRERKNELMAPMVSALSDEDIRDIAAYFATQATSRGRADSVQVARGSQLYRGGDAGAGIPACMSCHGPAGDGNALAGFPRLAGQHAPYTVKQLEAYRSGDRMTDQGSVMRTIAARLDDADINAVAQFMAGLDRAGK